MLGPEPKHSKDTYTAWLAYNKQKWKLQRVERLRVQSMGISTTSIRAQGGTGGLGSYFAQKSASTLRRHWEIIQIAETGAVLLQGAS